MLGLVRMGARASLVGGALALLLHATDARAHGEPPNAHAVIRADADGPVLIKLGVGFAQRLAPGRFRYVCPALWGGELTAPAAALPDGTVVVGANSGLMLFDADGNVRAHPDPVAAGFSTEVVASAGGVFALRFKQGQSELVAVDAEHARVVWSDSRVWYSLAPLQQGLVMLRSNNMTLEQVIVSFEGTLLDSQQAVALRDIDYAFARGLGQDAYALLLSQSAPELGRIQAGTFTRVAQAASSIAGPLATPEGALLAVDGQLTRLDGQPLGGQSETLYVSCLEHTDHGSFACTREGVSRVGPAGLGDEVFALAWLVPPDLSQLSDEKARARCDYQWQDLRFDLLALGMHLRFEDELGTDAGQTTGDASAEADALPVDAAEPPAEAPDASEEPGAPTKGSSRCALQPGGRHAVGWDAWGWLGLGALLLLRHKPRARHAG